MVVVGRLEGNLVTYSNVWILSHVKIMHKVKEFQVHKRIRIENYTLPSHFSAEESRYLFPVSPLKDHLET